MVTWFAKWLIEDYRDYSSPEVRKRYGVLCGAVGIGLNVILFLGKFLAGVFSHSVAITADAINNLSDAGSSLVILLGFRMAGQKPDRDHPFGHGRIEYLSGLLVALAILLMAVELMRTSFDKMLHPTAIVFEPVILVILVVSIFVKLYMFFYNRRIGKKIDSAAMTATATDSISDACATSVVLVSTVIAYFTGLQIDGYCGMLVGAFIFYAGFCAARDTINPLLGQPADPEFVKKIEKIVLSFEDIQGIHDLVVHNYGPGRIMISLHAEVPADGSLVELHEVIDDAENELSLRLGCETVIHMDPICNQDEETERMKELAMKKLHQLDETLSLHDFRMVSGVAQKKLVFDVLIPYDCKREKEKLLQELETLIQEECPEACLVVKFDRGYVE